VARNMPIMEVTMDPDTDPPVVVVLDLDTMKMDEAEECEKLTGWTRQQWLEALFEDRVRAVKFFIYLARKRAGDPVEWDDIDFDLGRTEWKALDDPDAPADAPAALGVGDDEAGVPTGPEAEQEPLLDDPA